MIPKLNSPSLSESFELASELDTSGALVLIVSPEQGIDYFWDERGEDKYIKFFTNRIISFPLVPYDRWFETDHRFHIHQKVFVKQFQSLIVSLRL